MKTTNHLTTGPFSISNQHQFDPASPVVNGIELTQLIHGLPVAIYSCDANGVLTMYNKAAAKLWGREPEIGKDVWCGSWKIFYPDGVPMPLAQCPMAIALMEGREVTGAEIVVERPNGDRRNVLPHPQPFFDDKGKLTGAVNTLIDITEQKHVNHVLLEKNKELEQFAYAASHDLQEPLNTIKSFINLLDEEYEFEDDVSKSFEYIKESANRLEHLITALLVHSRIGKRAEARKIDLNLLLERVLEDMKGTIQQKNAKIQMGPLPVIHAYPVEIRQLFQNLLSNALKFQRPENIPIVDIRAGKIGNNWHFTIADNGIGIEEKFKERIFIIFQRLHNNSEFEGTGIGLAHCKKIVDLHNGRIWVESEFGKGSTFHFTITEAT